MRREPVSRELAGAVARECLRRGLTAEEIARTLTAAVRARGGGKTEILRAWARALEGVNGATVGKRASRMVG